MKLNQKKEEKKFPLHSGLFGLFDKNSVSPFLWRFEQSMQKIEAFEY